MEKKVINFLSKVIWWRRLNSLLQKRSFFMRILRIIFLSLRGFNEDRCSLRASALTFYSLLSIVPLFAIAFGIAKGFGLDKILERQLMGKIPLGSEIIMKIINLSRSLLESAKGGVIAGVGVALLFWTVIGVLGNIERSFNDIWGIKNMRSFTRRFVDYLSVMLICPVLVVVAGSATVFITMQAKMMTQKVAILGAIAPVIHFLFSFSPYIAIWIVFTFIYIFVPNTKVNFSSGILAGIIAGTVYQVMQWVYVNFQIGVARYNAIYGSFAALPLFLLWLQLSWTIVFLGAEISFVHQNMDTYEFESDYLNVSRSFKNLLALRMVNLLSKNFARGQKAVTAQEISHTLAIPIRVIRDIASELTEAAIFVAIQEETNKVPAYQPAVDTNLLTIKYVLDKLEKRGTDIVPLIETKELKRIKDSLESFDKAIEKSPANLLLKDI